MKQLIGFTLLVALTATQVASQDWDKYKVRSLKQITTELAEASFKDPDVIITQSKEWSIILYG